MKDGALFAQNNVGLQGFYYSLMSEVENKFLTLNNGKSSAF